MLPSATSRFLAELPDDALVLDVGAWGAPLNRADWVIDLMPYATRGVMGSYGPKPERFTEETWVIHDICSREPWPFADDQFDFVVCATTLEDIRDPVGVCEEMSRVGKAGYVEVPTIEAELIYNVEGDGPYLGHAHHRWFVDVVDGELEFLHKSHHVHHDWTLRVVPRWREAMGLEDHLQGLFWDDELKAHERVVIGAYPDAELRARVRAKFRPTARELRAKELKYAASRQAQRAWAPLRQAAEKTLAAAGRGRP